MSIRIYYRVMRPTMLSDQERHLINQVVHKFSVRKKIEAYATTKTGLNWSSFGLDDPVGLPEGTILRGSTPLPDNNEDAVWTGVQHWCEALSAIRRAIGGATWHVHVDGHPIAWDSRMHAFDPSK